MIVDENGREEQEKRKREHLGVAFVAMPSLIDEVTRVAIAMLYPHWRSCATAVFARQVMPPSPCFPSPARLHRCCPLCIFPRWRGHASVVTLPSPHVSSATEERAVSSWSTASRRAPRTGTPRVRGS
jgi:hypothetical protein